MTWLSLEFLRWVKNEGKYIGGKKGQLLKVLMERWPAMKPLVQIFYLFIFLIMRIQIIFLNIIFLKVPVTLYSMQFSQHCLPCETPANNGAVMTLLVSWWTSQLILTPDECLDCRILPVHFCMGPSVSLRSVYEDMEEYGVMKKVLLWRASLIAWVRAWPNVETVQM